MVKNGCGQFGNSPLKLAVPQELIDGIHMHDGTNSGKGNFM